MLVQSAARGATAVGFNGQEGAAQGPAHAALIGEGKGLEGGSRGILSKTEELGNQQLQRQTTGAQAGAGKAHDSRHGVPLAKVDIFGAAKRKNSGCYQPSPDGGRIPSCEVLY